MKKIDTKNGRARSNGVAKKSIDNLKPLKKGTRRAHEIAKKGGLARKDQINKIRTLREIAEAVQGAKPNESLMAKIAEFCPEMATADATNAIAMICAISKQASEGDVRSAQYIGALMGQDPVTQVDVKSDGQKIQQVFALVPQMQDLKTWNQK